MSAYVDCWLHPADHCTASDDAINARGPTMIETKPKRSLQHWFDHVRIRPKRIRRQRPRRERKFETMDESVRIPYRRKDKQHGH